MALIVEDGTGKTDAESYISVADADTYHAKYGAPAAWTAANTAAKETALRNATQFVDGHYGPCWVGTKYSGAQRLDWPRIYVSTYDGRYVDPVLLPQDLKDATAYLAGRAVSETLRPDQSSPGTISAESVTVGPISESVSYEGGKTQQKQYSLADDLLAEWVEDTQRVRLA